MVGGACPVPAEFDASVGCIVRDPVSKKKKIVRTVLFLVVGIL